MIETPTERQMRKARQILHHAQVCRGMARAARHSAEEVRLPGPLAQWDRVVTHCGALIEEVQEIQRRAAGVLETPALAPEPPVVEAPAPGSMCGHAWGACRPGAQHLCLTTSPHGHHQCVCTECGAQEPGALDPPESAADRPAMRPHVRVCGKWWGRCRDGLMHRCTRDLAAEHDCICAACGAERPR